MEASQTSLIFPDVQYKPLKPSQKVAIDSFFPESEANELAKLESYNKHLFRPNTYLHKWWARRSGTTFRYILKQLTVDERCRDYYSPGGLDGITILDPMMGGGTTLHEAIRLGANVVGYDIDPIPVLQAKASLANMDIVEKENVFNVFFSEITKKLKGLYKTHCPICHIQSYIQFTLYGLRKQLGTKEVVVIDSYILRVETNGTVRSITEFYPDKLIQRYNREWQIVDKSEARKSGINKKDSDLLSHSFTQRYIPLLIVGECPEHNTFFKTLDSFDLENLNRAANHTFRFTKDNAFAIPQGPKSDDLTKRNINYYYELFYPRQLIYIVEAKKLIKNTPAGHHLWLTLLVSTSLEFNSALCGYKGANARRPGAIRHVFSHHAYSFPSTSLENNPVFPRPQSGNLLKLFRSRILEASKWAVNPVERRRVNSNWEKIAILGESDTGTEINARGSLEGFRKRYFVCQNDSSSIPDADQSLDFVVTDPPYFDSVQYSDLSNFFRCWLRWFLPGAANWDFVVSDSAVAENSNSEKKFGEVLGKIWKESNRVLKRPHGRLIFTYHHWRPRAWAQLSIALKAAEFQLVNAYVVHSENPISVHILNLRALQHDAILVLCPKELNIAPKWDEPTSVPEGDSYGFCKGCASMLGWVLQTELSGDQIVQKWCHYLKSI